MAIGILNPGDAARTSATRPAATLTALNQRRWFSDALRTEIRDQDLNAILGQLRYVYDFYAIADVEGDDTMLQRAIQAGALVLTGNLAALQSVIGGTDKVPYWTSNTVMSTFTASSYSRSLLAKTSVTQWQDALGIGASSSPNVIAFAGLVGGADTLPYFTGTGIMSQTGFTATARTLLDDTTTTAMRTTLGLGTMATQSATAYATLASANSFSAINTFSAEVDINARLYVYNVGPTTGSYVSVVNTVATGKDAFFCAGGLSPGAVGVPATRFAFGKDDTPEVSGDAGFVGSNFRFIALGGPDASTEVQIGNVYTIARATRIFAFVMSPTAPTPTYPDNTTKLATTAYVATATAGITAGMQPLDPDLTSIAALTTAADRVLYFSGPGVAALAPFTAFGRSLVATADAAAVNTLLGLSAVAKLNQVNTVGPSTYLGFPGGAEIGTQATRNQAYWKMTAGTSIAMDTSFGDQLSITVDTYLAMYFLANEVQFAPNTSVSASTFGIYSHGSTYYPDAMLGMASDAGKNRSIWSGTWTGALSTKARWELFLGDNTAEGGSNAGSNLKLVAYNDAGTSLGNVFTVARATRVVDFAIAPTIAGVALGAAYQPLDATLTAYAAFAGVADAVPYFTAADVLASMTVTSVARTLLDDTTTTIMRTTLGLGTAATIATGTSGATIPLLSTANTWSNQQTFQLGQASANPVNIISTDAANLFGPLLPLRRSSASPAAADDLAQILFDGNTSAIANTTYADIYASIVNPTVGAMAGKLTIRTQTAGALTIAVTIGAGLFLGSVTGGDKGTGTLNATALYENGAALSTLYAPAAGGGYQPLDAELSAIAGLTSAADTQPYFTGSGTAALAAFPAFGRSLSGVVDAAAGRTLLAAAPLASPALTGTPTAPTATLGDSSVQIATTAFVAAAVAAGGSGPLDPTLVAFSALAGTADQMAYWTGADAFALTTVTAVARAVLDDTTYAAMLTTMGAQPLDATLTAFAGVAGAADKVPYFTAADVFTTMTVTSAARTVLDDTTVAAMLTTMGGAPLASPTFTGSVNVVSLTASSMITSTGGDIKANGGMLSTNRSGSAVDSMVWIIADAGKQTYVSLRTVGTARWQFGKDAVAEGGSNVGSNFFIEALADAGTSLGNALTIARATRVVDFAVVPTVAGVALSTTYATVASLASYAPLTSPALLGTPTAPTAGAGFNTTQIATCAFVQQEITADLAGYQPLDATLTAFAGVVGAADKFPYFTAADVLTTTTITSVARTVLDDTTTAAMLTTLGAQPLDATLTAYAAFAGAADAVPYFTAADVLASMTVTAAARTVLDDTTTAAMLTTLGAAPLAAPSFTGAQVFIPNGTVSLPGLSWSGDPDTGLRWNVANSLSLTAGGADMLICTATSGVFAKHATFSIFPNSGSATLSITGTVGTSRAIHGSNTSGHRNWQIELGDATAESPANSGSNFTLSRYDDSSAATIVATVYRLTGGMVYGAATTGGDKGDGTINAAGLFVNGVAVSAGGGAAVGSANTFTAQQTFSLASASAVPVQLISTDAGALFGPAIDLYRDSASPAAADIMGSVRWFGRDSAAAKLELGAIEASWSDIGTSSKRTLLTHKTYSLNTYQTQMIVGSGVIVGDTGTMNGLGTLTVKVAAYSPLYYENGIRLDVKYEALGKLAAVDTKTASYTLALTDIGKVIELNVASANTLTIPPNSTVAFVIGSRIDIVQYGAGQTTLTPGAGVTIRSSGTKLKLTGLYAAASLYKRGTDEWVAMGDLSA